MPLLGLVRQSSQIASLRAVCVSIATTPFPADCGLTTTTLLPTMTLPGSGAADQGSSPGAAASGLADAERAQQTYFQKQIYPLPSVNLMPAAHARLSQIAHKTELRC